jgi:hypothetical protein
VRRIARIAVAQSLHDPDPALDQSAHRLRHVEGELKKFPSDQSEYG